MTKSSFENDVLAELGDDKLNEIASVLGTDAVAARNAMAITAVAISNDLQRKAEGDDAEEVRRAFAEIEAPGLQDVTALGGGPMTGLLTKLSRPVAEAVSKKTGIPASTVSRAIELLIPVVLAVLNKRAAAGEGAMGPTPGEGEE